MSNLTTIVRPLICTALTGGAAGALDAIVTTSLTPPVNARVTTTGLVSYAYQLTAGTDAEDSPSVIRPDDYNAATNAKVWKLCDPLIRAATQEFKLSGSISPSGLATGNTNDWNPTGLATASTIRVSVNNLASAVITGLQGGVAGRLMIIECVSAPVASLFISHDDTNSSAANRFYLGNVSAGSILKVPLNSGLLFRYDGTLSRWMLLVGGFASLQNDLGGTSIAPQCVAASAQWAFKGFVDLPITTDQNNYATSVGSKAVGLLSGAAALSITGIGAIAGGFQILVNTSAYDKTLKHESSSSTAANRFSMGDAQDYVLVPGAAVAIQYDSTNSRWRVLGSGSLSKRGGICTGDLTISARLTADKWSNTQSALTYSATTNLDFDGVSVRTLALTGNVTFTTSNRAAGRMMKIIITADDERSLTYPAWIGDDELPSTIDETQTMVLTLECTGSGDSEIIASSRVFTT